MQPLNSLLTACRCREGQRHWVPSLARRAAAIAILSASALDAQAFCFTMPANDTVTATASAGGGYTYSGTVSAGRACGSGAYRILSEFYMPYFADMAISNISQSADWTHDIEATNDLFHVGGGVIHFSLANPSADTPIVPTNFGYTFNASFAPIASASLIMTANQDGTTMANLIPQGTVQMFGQTFLVPGSPNAVAGFAAAVPEPSTMAMFGAGLGLIGFAAARRKRGSQGLS